MSKKYQDFYDCTKLINSLDKYGKKPEIFIVCSSDRGPGKTTQFSKKLLTDYFEDGSQFVLLTRRNKNLGQYAKGVLSSYLDSTICPYKGKYTVKETIQMNGAYSYIYLQHRDDEDNLISENCGFVISLNSAENIKEVSSTFVNVKSIFFDEFMPMRQTSYLPGDSEVPLFKNIHESIARGNGSSVRYVPVYMSSNTIDIQNPYFIAMDIVKNIQCSEKNTTKFYKGDGFVFEYCIVDGLAEKHAASGFNRAFKNDDNNKKSNIWLLYDNSLVERPGNWGRGTYMCTLLYKNIKFGIVDYPQMGYKYLTRKVDSSCQYVYNTTKDGGALNKPLLKKSLTFINLGKYFFNGQMRCQDGSLQRIAIDIFT